MPKGISLTQEEQTKRRREIFNAAVNVFLKQGFQETSVGKIAEAAGIGRSTLYDYFKNKDDILVFFVEAEVSELTRRTEEISLQSIEVVEKLHQIMLIHLEFLAQNKELYLKLMMETMQLSLESQKRIQVKRYAYQDLLSSIIEQGVQQGVFRPVDPLLVARLMINSITPVVYASRPTRTPQEMLEETIAIFLKGIQA
jgi:AcrR family transcriptional regulator